MISIKVNTKIFRPICEVFDFIAKQENNPLWQYGALDSVQISEGAVNVGTVFSSIGHFMGRRIESTFEVTDFEPNKFYGFKTISGPVKMHTSYQFFTVDGSTLIMIATQVNPSGFFKLLDPIVARTAKKQFRENLKRLKKLLEAKNINTAPKYQL